MMRLLKDARSNKAEKKEGSSMGKKRRSFMKQDRKSVV